MPYNAVFLHVFTGGQLRVILLVPDSQSQNLSCSLLYFIRACRIFNRNVLLVFVCGTLGFGFPINYLQVSILLLREFNFFEQSYITGENCNI